MKSPSPSLVKHNLYLFRQKYPVLFRYTVSSFSVLIFFLLLDNIFPVYVNIRYSTIVTANDGTVLYSFLSPDDKWRMKTELPEIIPALKTAVIAKEDRWFYWHFGVNPIAVIRAAFNNIIHLRTTSGASTITMQVARLLEPKNRTFWNKLTETFRAVQLELHYSKNEILQMYLNLVPFGGNVEGVKAASLIYFGRLPDHLSLAQITALTIIPNRPTSLSLGKNNDLIQKERNKWLYRFRKRNLFPARDIQDALNEPLDAVRHDPPRIAPHFALRMKLMFPNEAIIKTGLRNPIQQKIEQLALNYSRRMRFTGVNNASVLILDNQTHNVVGYIGNPDFNDINHQGQVDGVKAVRSPGSALKPLIYALAIDKGLLTPKTIITDVPVNFDGFAPENFNRKFNGSISVEKALAFSLNVPAVKTLDKLGVPLFVDKLHQLGFQQIRKDSRMLGLSVALGGCGVRLEELTNLYCVFANGGEFYPLQWLKQSNLNQPSKVMSKGAAFMVTEILTQPTRPDIPNLAQSSIHVPKIAWKTGTSYGRRDAWSVGYNKRYTIGVWVGNFDGTGAPELTGADAATPLLFDIFNSLEYNSDNSWFERPASVDFRLVCSESGLPPNDYCENQIIDYFIPTISTNRKCEHLKTVFISADENFSYCTSCLPENGYKRKEYPNLEPELISFYESEHIGYIKIPSHNPGCSRIFSDRMPTISSPVNGKTYLLERGEDQKIMLSCTADNEVKVVYWYINDRFFQSADAGAKVFIAPPEGQVKISCSDDKGRNSNIRVTIGFQ
ncbi:MAG: penicillin-binding protein 1C [Ignavibacteriae bacterium]|nr:penicillin-binding protein 1C [Ignavibacteriota bacterium]